MGAFIRQKRRYLCESSKVTRDDFKFWGVKPVLPSNWMSRMTHSRDREHRTPFSPVRRHESITEAALLSRRDQTQTLVIETAIFWIKFSSFSPLCHTEEAATTVYLRSWSDSIPCGNETQRRKVPLLTIKRVLVCFTGL